VSDVDFQPLARRTYVAEAIRTIKDMILDGRLAPGQRLPPERSLSEALGVSRPTVREAIRSLQAMNILESRHGAGTFVASLSVDELLRPLQFALSLAAGGLEHLFEVRLLLEPGAAALAAERATPEQVAGLRDCVARAAAEAIDDADAMLRLDMELHQRIVDASDNPLLQHLLAATVALGEESRAYTVQLPGVRPRTVVEHRAIVEAIADGDAAAARAAMAAHIGRIRDKALTGARAGAASAPAADATAPPVR
jgi:DNA-binding FadR family transcriptional regulator